MVLHCGKRFDIPHTLLLMYCFYVYWTISTGAPRKTDWVLEQWQEIKSKSRSDFRTLLTSIPRLINKSIKIVKLNLIVLYYNVALEYKFSYGRKGNNNFLWRPSMDFLPLWPLTFQQTTWSQTGRLKRNIPWLLISFSGMQMLCILKLVTKTELV